MTFTPEFPHVQAGCLPTGTVTTLGTIVQTSLTAYLVERDELRHYSDGDSIAVVSEWVPFYRLHGRPAPVMPLVTLR